MSKKSKHHYQQSRQHKMGAPVSISEIKNASSISSAISKRGKKTIAAGIAAAIAGFIILSFADPAGKNFASHLAPFVIIAGYVTIGIGIILPDKPIHNHTTAGTATPRGNTSATSPDSANPGKRP